MSPTLAISAANVGQNILQAVAAPASRPARRADELQPLNFQKFLQKAAAIPEFQKASFLASEGIHSPAQAQEKLGDLGAQVLQDPEVQRMVAGDSSPVEMRFLPDGAVSIKTSDGRQKTIQLDGETKKAAQKAASVAGYLQSSQPARFSAPASTLSPGNPGAVGIKILPGSGTATLLP